MYCGFLMRVVFMVFCEICLGLFPFNSETRTQLFYLFIKYPLWIITEYYYWLEETSRDPSTLISSKQSLLRSACSGLFPDGKSLRTVGTAHAGAIFTCTVLMVKNIFLSVQLLFFQFTPVEHERTRDKEPVMSWWPPGRSLWTAPQVIPSSRLKPRSHSASQDR